MTITELQRRLDEFADARDWRQFHSPKNLVMALTAELGELAELFQWLTPDESATVMDSAKTAAQVCDELADVMIYLALIAGRLGVDLLEQANLKVDRNEIRYPQHIARGRAAKYDVLRGES